MSDTPRLILERYQLGDVIGEGAFGVVCRAFDTRLKRPVAIKSLKRSMADTDPGHFRLLEDRFPREAEAGACMGSHPNLVTVFDLAIDADGTRYLMLEYVPGGTLGEKLITNGALNLTDMLRLTADIARGLQEAHKHGIVHRDIKPANIFLAENGHAKVGDFGIAQMDHLSGWTHGVVGHPGTPLYMSPEQAQMIEYVRPASDQYSLGLVLFEMLTGEAYKRVGDRVASALLQNQPHIVAEIVETMLAQHPDDRFSSMKEVARVIHAIERRREMAETQKEATRSYDLSLLSTSPPVDTRVEDGDGDEHVMTSTTTIHPDTTEPPPSLLDTTSTISSNQARTPSLPDSAPQSSAHKIGARKEGSQSRQFRHQRLLHYQPHLCYHLHQPSSQLPHLIRQRQYPVSESLARGQQTTGPCRQLHQAMSSPRSFPARKCSRS